jgi:hypothetical protein
MLNIIQNTIGAIRRVGESVVRAGLKMWLPFTKAEPLGVNVVTDGSFNDTSEWIKENGWVVSGGLATRTDVDSYTALQQNCLVSGTTYIVTIVVDSVTSGNIFGIRLGTNYILQGGLSVGTHTATGTANSNVLSIMGNPDFAGTISSISIQEYAQETPDISGNDNNAILKTGKALVFAGNDSVETSFPSSKTIKTIAFWIYPTHSNTGETLFYFGGSSFGTRFLHLSHLTLKSDSFNNTNFNVYIDGVARGETNIGGNNPTLVINEWQRVVLTSSTDFNTTLNTLDVASKGFGSDGRFKMADLQIYGTEFTTDDIAYDYANPQKLVTDNASSNVTLNDLHAWWHMSEGDGTIAFDSSSATRYDGLIIGATYESGQERIPQLGMMNWSKGSNLIEYSEDLTEWSELSSAVVSFDSSIVNPDGTVGCYKVTFDGTFRGRIEYNVAIDGIVVESVYLRVESGTQAAKIGGSSSSLGDVTVTDQWQRFSHSATYTGTSTNPRVRCDDAAVIYVWGVQYESGASASAYRRTNGTAVTDATLISCAADSQKDILGNAVRVKGSGFNLDGTGYAEVLDDNVFDIPQDGAFTFMGWLKFKFVSTGSGVNVVYANGGLSTDTNTFSINTNNSNKVIAYISGTFTEALDSSFDKTDGDWVFFAITRNAGSDIKFYLNKVDTDGVEKPMLARTRSNNNSLTNANVKYIGRDSGTTRFYKERIDDLILYNTELSLDDITQNYNATKSGHNN